VIDFGPLSHYGYGAEAQMENKKLLRS
jgi:hypothetical protein